MGICYPISGDNGIFTLGVGILNTQIAILADQPKLITASRNVPRRIIFGASPMKQPPKIEEYRDIFNVQHIWLDTVCEANQIE